MARSVDEPISVQRIQVQFRVYRFGMVVEIQDTLGSSWSFWYELSGDIFIFSVSLLLDLGNRLSNLLVKYDEIKN